MFKIKDSVNLEELEKFGFELEKDCYVYIEEEKKTNWHGGTINNLIGVRLKSGSDFNIFGGYGVSWSNGQIEFSNYSFESRNAYKTLNKLYDLIKADMVEKVEE